MAKRLPTSKATDQYEITRLAHMIMLGTIIDKERPAGWNCRILTFTDPNFVEICLLFESKVDLKVYNKNSFIVW